MIQLDHCSIEWKSYGSRVVFPDRSETSAWPDGSAHYYVIAHRCGYEDRITAYCREHELAHALVGEEFYGWESPVLAASARKLLPPVTAPLEEGMAQMIQRWVRANELPIIGGVDWHAIKTRFLHLVQQLDAEGPP